MVRIPAELADRIDRLRGELVPRERYVRWLLEKALKAEERLQEKALEKAAIVRARPKR